MSHLRQHWIILNHISQLFWIRQQILGHLSHLWILHHLLHLGWIHIHSLHARHIHIWHAHSHALLSEISKVHSRKWIVLLLLGLLLLLLLLLRVGILLSKRIVILLRIVLWFGMNHMDGGSI